MQPRIIGLWPRLAAPLAGLLLALLPLAALAAPLTVVTEVHSAGTVTLNAADGIILGANITSDTGQIILNGPVTLGADVVLHAAQGVVVNGTLNGAHRLTVVSGGSSLFGQAAGGAVPLTELTVSGGGALTIAGGLVTTTGGQHYEQIILGADTTLISGPSGLITFSGVAQQGHTLTVHGGPVPTVSSVSGCLDSGSTTSACPTSGGTVLQVVGSGFVNTFPPTVNAGTNVTVLDDTHLSFTLRPGTPDETIVLQVTTVGGTSTGSAATIRFAATPPTVTSVFGCAAAGNATNECPLAGGVQLTIGGSGFSQGAPTVNVCNNVVLTSDTQLTCTLNPGAPGVTLAVIVTTDGGPSAAGAATVTYTLGTGGGGGTGGGTGGDGGTGEPPSATPELDSLLLFGAGVSGLSGYALMRLRARRRRD